MQILPVPVILKKTHQSPEQTDKQMINADFAIKKMVKHIS